MINLVLFLCFLMPVVPSFYLEERDNCILKLIIFSPLPFYFFIHSVFESISAFQLGQSKSQCDLSVIDLSFKWSWHRL